MLKGESKAAKREWIESSYGEDGSSIETGMLAVSG
jgi:hypothetical protein